jgi:hypothetical protein
MPQESKIRWPLVVRSMLVVLAVGGSVFAVSAAGGSVVKLLTSTGVFALLWIIIVRPEWPDYRKPMSYRDYAAWTLFITVGALVWVMTGWGLSVLHGGGPPLSGLAPHSGVAPLIPD